MYVSYSAFDKEERCLLQKPVSRPTEKQLASWLKEADKATGSLELSIAGLVFMVEPDASITGGLAILVKLEFSQMLS